MRAVDLFDEIQTNGYHAQMMAIPCELLLLILRTDYTLSSFVNEMIGNDGFKFRYCHDDDPTGKSVIIFLDAKRSVIYQCSESRSDLSNQRSFYC